MTLSQAIAKLARLLFFPYQWNWTEAWAVHKFIGILGGRQLGKDWWLEYMLAWEFCVRREVDWVVISATRGHAKIFLRGVRRWIDKFRRLAISVQSPFPDILVDSAFELVSSWGTTVSVSSGTVRSLTGKRGGVILNEVPLIPDASDLFPSAFAQVERAIDLGKPVKLIMVGNASFIGTYWHEWWTTRIKSPGDWRMITQPWSSGLRLCGKSEFEIKERAQKILANLGGNQAAFNQWYECDFRSAEGCLFEPELIMENSYDDTTFSCKDSRDFIGYDVGRVNDPSTWATVQVHNGVGYMRNVREEFDMSIPEQRALTRSLCTANTGSVTIDATGIGRALVDDLRAELRGITMLRDFTIGSHSKWELFGLLRAAISEGKVQLPLSDVDLRMQLESIQTELNAQDKVKVILPRIGNQHGDKAVAAALAVHGASHRLRVKAPTELPTVHHKKSLMDGGSN